MSKNTEVQYRVAWTREEIEEVIWCYMYYRKYLTDNYKMVYVIWRRRRLDGRMYMDAKKLTFQKNRNMNKKVTEMETEEMKKELQDDQRHHVNKSEGKQLE
jgi:ribosomal protein L7/L12